MESGFSIREVRAQVRARALETPRVHEPCVLVIFGATGDLAGRKLMPALFRLWQNGFFTAPFVIIGPGRRQLSDEQFRQERWERAVAAGALSLKDAEAWQRFAASLFYHLADFTKPEHFRGLAERVEALEKQHDLPGNRLFYLATDPDYFSAIVERLSGAGLARRGGSSPWSRVVIEKPFGKDLDSARELDRQLAQFLREYQIYRIDHYLGKETVQNIVSVRFGNAIFEPIFNRRYVDHVQITMAETIGVEGRGAYYDHAGALRDVVQNHLLQLLALVAMEPPGTLEAKDIHDEKMKVLRHLTPLKGAALREGVVRGQYAGGVANGKAVSAYRDEPGVAPDSTTETFIALKTQIDTWRWAGVPFILRAGKRLARRVTEISVVFKLPPLGLFTTVQCEGEECDIAHAQPNVLVFHIQPDEGLSLTFSTKRPGMRIELEAVDMTFAYGDAHAGPLPEAYERLLLDALRGDSTLFTRSDEVLAAWEFVTPILRAWEREPPAFPNYAPGTWGPPAADRLLTSCQLAWRQP